MLQQCTEGERLKLRLIQIWITEHDIIECSGRFFISTLWDTTIDETIVIDRLYRKHRESFDHSVQT